MMALHGYDTGMHRKIVIVALLFSESSLTGDRRPVGHVTYNIHISILSISMHDMYFNTIIDKVLITMCYTGT